MGAALVIIVRIIVRKRACLGLLLDLLGDPCLGLLLLPLMGAVASLVTFGLRTTRKSTRDVDPNSAIDRTNDTAHIPERTREAMNVGRSKPQTRDKDEHLVTWPFREGSRYLSSAVENPGCLVVFHVFLSGASAPW